MQQRLTDKPPSLEILLGCILILTAAIFVGLLVLSFRGTRRRKRKDSDHHEIYREPIPVPWPVYAVIVLLFAALAGLVWWARQPTTVMERQAKTLQPMTASQEEAIKESPPPPPEAGDEHGLPGLRILEYILAISLLAGLGWAAWRSWIGRAPKAVPEATDLGEIVAQAVLDLQKGRELSDVVLRCYRDMCAILGRKVVLRKEMTAREFAQRLQQVGVGEKEVLRLTNLFERVRYGRHQANPDERVEAITLLQSIESQYGKVAHET